ncbi:general substrate transporter [Myxozyma melibiosi]|uniref:General substrate transporter n=1 Tax=Myxozyma melibiosi TaxID=54550 RepID=A0ABR1F853_9ASCO
MKSQEKSQDTVPSIRKAVPEDKPADDFVEDRGVLTSEEAIYDPIEDKFGGPFMWLITTSAAVGGLLFGYDLAIISGVLLMVGTDLDGKSLSSNNQELLTSITSGGAFIGALIAGYLLDRKGRRFVIGFGAIFFTAGSIIQASSFTLAQMTVGRLVVGLGIGEAAMVAPIYIAEISPARIRGRMVTIDALAITFGQVFANVLNIAFEHVTNGWRYSVGIGAVPSLALLALCFVVPETPRYLIRKNRIEEANRVTAKIYIHATAEEIATKSELIRQQFELEAELLDMTLRQQLHTLYHDSANVAALLVACGLMGIQQFAGSNTLIYYAPTLFALCGFKNAIAVSIVVTGANFLFGLFSLRYLDAVGRRRFLIYTMWGMPIALVVAAVAIHFIPINSDLTVTNADMTWAGVVVLVCIILFIAFYSSALGNIAWLGNELFPMEVRSLGTMMVTLTCWGSNIVVSSTYLSMMKTLTPSGTFGFYAGINVISWIVVILCYPEVSGLTLEEIKGVFRRGFGPKSVTYSMQLQKERNAANKERQQTMDAANEKAKELESESQA